MMSRVLIFFSFCYSFLLTAQQHFDLEWNDEILYGYEDSYQKIPGFDLGFMDYNIEQGLFYVNQWQEQGRINPGTVKASNVVYETVSESYLKDLNRAAIPDQLKITAKTTTARGINRGFVRISAIINENGVYKKVRSFDLNYSTTGNFAAKSAAVSRLAISNSVLASGEWFRFSINQTGVYRITPDFLTSLGMNLGGVDPRTIKIYGHGGKSLPLLNSLNTDFDIPEVAIQLIGGDDGSFSGSDAILFYGESTLGYVEENDSHINPYADTSYYYVTSGGGTGKRVTTVPEPTAVATTQITSYEATLFEERDLVTLSKSGRRWFGDLFDIELQRNYTFSFPELVPNSSLDITVKTASKSFSASSMEVLAGNTSLGVMNFNPIVFPNLANEDDLNGAITATGNSVGITLRYDQAGNPENEAYLDYIQVKGDVPLKGYGEQYVFSNSKDIVSTGGIGEYILSNTAGVSAIWDVTDPRNAMVVANNLNNNSITFKSSIATFKNYVVLDNSDLYIPQVPQNSRVANQNLKGAIFKDAQGNFEDLEYLIVTNNELLSAANRLADFHNARGVSTKVVALDLIYNEFSSGKLDIGAIRNFVRYVYENASAPENRLKYLCLFGDTSVDYKNNRLDTNNNIVPVFESLESNNVRNSFMTDDYYAMLDPDEGEVTIGDQLDVATGRILVDTPANANAMVDKIISYSSKPSFGSWRNQHLYMSDDVDDSWEGTIQENLNIIADKVDRILPSSNVQKIHMDSFRQVSIAGGNRYPEANAAMLDAIESGVLVVNYFGHGGEEGLAQELVFTQADARDLQNTNRYPLFITVTCNFTKFDNPERITAGELMYLNPNGGAISMITTTRQIGVREGIAINDKLPDFLFPESEIYTSVAQSLTDTKNSIINRDSPIVFYIGDPAMKLTIPKRQVRLTRINDVPIGTADIGSLEALGRVKLSGEVFKGNAVDAEYNGVLSTIVFDKKEERTTLANDGTRNTSGVIEKLTYEQLGGVIFKGKSSVKNGVFDVEFIVPRDVKIQLGTGRVSFYAENTTIEEDQSGRDDTILVGGINENAPEDVQGPTVSLFLNDENFVSGGTVNNSPILIAKLQDENGINTSSGIGHDIIAILDGDETNPIVLNDFYETELDDFTKGTLNFKFRDLAPGTHTLSVRVWDVYNNSTTQELEFVVLEDEDFTIENVLNYPNPLINYTEFWFSHNNPSTAQLEVQVQVFTVSGKVIWTRNQTVSGKRTYQNDITWDGRDNFGDRVGKGVYVYKISVKSTLTNKTVEKFEKLVIL